MSNHRESAAERIARMKQAKQEAQPAEVIKDLTKEESTDDFTEIVEKLQERKEQEAKGENDGYQKMTIYIRDDIAQSFNALITKRGQQKEFANIAFADFVKKKVRELGLN